MTSVDRTIRLDLSYHLPASPAELWPILSDTDRINRQIGLPITRPVPLDGQPVRRSTVRARFLGRTLEWVEEPFEFVENSYYEVRRRFASGPVREFIGGVRLAAEGSGTAVHVRSSFTPSHSIGAAIIRAQIFVVRRKWDRLIAGALHHLTRIADAPFEPGIAAAPAAIQQATRARIQAIAGDAARVPLADKLFSLLALAPDRDLLRIRPVALARLWSVDRYEALRLCLRLARLGVLDLSWDLLCPNCLGAAGRTPGLSQLPREGHCDSCQITFDSSFDRAVEVTFRPNPRIRSIDEVVYCAAGPQNTPHIAAQFVLLPGETRTVDLNLDRGPYRLRNLTASLSSTLLAGEARQGTHTIAAWMTESGLLVDPEDRCVASGSVALNVTNQTSSSQQVILDRPAGASDCMTAAEVTVFQEFRDLFSSELLSPEARLSIRTLPVLFTDLRGSTSLYQQLGDAPAYSLVRDHFAVLREVVARHGGGIIKTIGDSVMAAFPTPVAAVRCALEMQQDLAHLNERSAHPLILKVGVHAGPCIAVRTFDDRLDYFGSTVNLAARAHSQSRGADVVLTREARRDPDVDALVSQLPQESFTASLRGLGEVTLVRLILDPSA